jgi:hypothetical protein
MTTDKFCFCFQNRLIQTSQTGGQRYNDNCPISITGCWYQKGLYTLAKFVGENVEQCDRNRKDPICVALPWT